MLLLQLLSSTRHDIGGTHNLFELLMQAQIRQLRRQAAASHVAFHLLSKGQEASLRVEPRVRAQLFLVRFEGLDNTTYSKFEIPLRTPHKGSRRQY